MPRLMRGGRFAGPVWFTLQGWGLRGLRRKFFLKYSLALDSAPAKGYPVHRIVRENSCRPEGLTRVFASPRHLRAGLSYSAPKGFPQLQLPAALFQRLLTTAGSSEYFVE